MVKPEKVTELQCMFLNSCQLRVLLRRDDESFYVEYVLKNVPGKRKRGNRDE